MRTVIRLLFTTVWLSPCAHRVPLVFAKVAWRSPCAQRDPLIAKAGFHHVGTVVHVALKRKKWWRDSRVCVREDVCLHALMHLSAFTAMHVYMRCVCVQRVGEACSA